MEEEDFDDRPIMIFLIMVAGIILFLIVLFSSIHVGKIEKKDLPIICDSPSNILKEMDAPCPECGHITPGINGEIVCRNEECSLYGMAVKVNS